jgi:ammonium transporter Rh
MKSNMDSLSTIITFGALIGKVSPVQLIILGMFQSMLYHVNRYVVELLLGGVDDMGGATVTHVFGAVCVKPFPHCVIVTSCAGTVVRQLL